MNLQETKNLTKAELEHLGALLQRDVERVDTQEWKEISLSLIDKFGFTR